jgi:dihydrofolate reductase
MNVSIIAAIARGGVIGRGGDLPWHLPADLRRFRKLTTGHHILMGRKTFQSLGRPLPERANVVISGQADYDPPGVLVARGLDEALARARAAGETEAFVIGGAEIFRLALPLADRLYLTQIDAEIAGDTYFPDYEASKWRLVEQSEHAADEKNPFPMTFLRYERVR